MLVRDQLRFKFGLALFYVVLREGCLKSIVKMACFLLQLRLFRLVVETNQTAVTAEQEMSSRRRMPSIQNEIADSVKDC